VSAVVQHRSSYPASSLAYSSNVAAGNLLVCCFMWDDTGVQTPTVASSNNGSWTVITPFGGGTATAVGIAYKENSAAGADTVTISGITGGDLGLSISEISGIATSGSLHAGPTNTAGSSAVTNPTSGNLVTTQTCFLLALLGDDTTAQGSCVAGAGMTLLDNELNHFHSSERQTGAAAGTYTPSFTLGTATGNWKMMAVAFLESSGGGTPPQKQIQIYSPRRRARLRRVANSRAIVLLKAPRGVSQIDPTTLAGAATMSASLTSGISLATSLTGHGDLSPSPSLLTGTSVTAALQGSATLSASLSTAIPLDTLFHGTGTLAADLTTGISLSSSLLGAATFTASLTTGATVARPSIIQVSGYRRSQRRARNRRQTILQLVAYQPGPASGALNASLLGTATLTASLTTGIRLQASLTGAATMTAALTTQVQLATALTGAGTLAAALSTQIPLATNLTGAATLLANLLAGSSLTASLLGVGTLAADLNAGAATMAAALIGTATLSSDLTTGQGFGVNLIARALLNASLATSIPLGASLSASAMLSATLTAFAGSQILKGKLRVVPAWIATFGVNPHV
jgi:hypothetical protein